jgi:uncharacterized protein
MTEMITKLAFGRSKNETTVMAIVAAIIVIVTIWFAVRFVNPAPPSKLVIAVGDGEGDYAEFAKQYHKQMLSSGVDLEIRPTTGTVENVALLEDPKSGVSVGFVHDGLVTQDEAPNIVSLGSLYYEPLWIFVSKKLSHLSRLTDLAGKRICLGEKGTGTVVLGQRLLENSGITEKNAVFMHELWENTHQLFKDGKVDVAFFIGPPEDDIIEELLDDPNIRLMSLDNAEAMQRKLPFLHHLTLPHGAINLAKNSPPTDIEMVAPTATLLAKKSIHPALVHLLLTAATSVHSDAGVFEKANEFPSDKDFEIDLSEEARQFYKNGAPAWHRYLPFWLATLLERLVVIAVPFFAIVLPALKTIPRFFNWRARRKILGQYAELKFIEVQMRTDSSPQKINEYVKDLRKIEDRVSRLKVPLEFAEQLYGLRANIRMVHEQISQNIAHRGGAEHSMNLPS